MIRFPGPGRYWFARWPAGSARRICTTWTTPRWVRTPAGWRIADRVNAPLDGTPSTARCWHRPTLIQNGQATDVIAPERGRTRSARCGSVLSRPEGGAAGRGARAGADVSVGAAAAALRLRLRPRRSAGGGRGRRAADDHAGDPHGGGRPLLGIAANHRQRAGDGRPGAGRGGRRRPVAAVPAAAAGG